MHFGARFYHPYLNHWIQPDSIVPEPGNPQTLNRYAFVNNNPVNATDPSGHAACYDTGVEIGSGISQADCWAYGRDKWIYGWDVAAPLAGMGYSTERGLFQTQSFDDGGGEFSIQLYYIYSYYGGEAAVNWIADRYDINLPSGVSWGYINRDDSIWCDRYLTTCVTGYSPLDDKDEYGLADNKVYVSYYSFDLNNFDPQGIVSTLIHEARHAWVESYLEKQSSDPYVMRNLLAGGYGDDLERDANYTVLYVASAYGVSISPRANREERHLLTKVNGCEPQNCDLVIPLTVNIAYGPEFGR
jgi:hypothetical protein